MSTNEDFIVESTPLFNLILRGTPGRTEKKINASMFRSVKATPRKGVNGSEITVVFDGCPEADLKVICRFRVRENDPWLRTNIEVLNNTDLAVEEVFFPLLHFKKQIGLSGADDQLLIPHGGGAIYKSPGTLESVSQQNPGLSSFQMLAFYFDDNAGLICIHSGCGRKRKIL